MPGGRKGGESDILTVEFSYVSSDSHIVGRGGGEEKVRKSQLPIQASSGPSQLQKKKERLYLLESQRGADPPAPPTLGRGCVS